MADQRGLACTVGSDQTEDGAAWHAQAEVIQSEGGAEAARQPFDANYRLAAVGRETGHVSFLLALTRDLVALPDQVEKVVDADVHEPRLGEQGVDPLG